MSTYTLDQTTQAGNRGSHYNPGAAFLYYVNEASGTIWRQPVNPATLLKTVDAQLLGSSSQDINGDGVADLSLIGGGVNGTQFAPLTATSLDTITPQQLMTPTDPWSSTLPDISSPTANVFCTVRIPYLGDHHYAALRIYKQGSQTKVDWRSYITSTKPLLLLNLFSAGYMSPRDIVVAEDESEMYICGGGSTDGYILRIPRVIDLTFPVYSTNPEQLNFESLQNPQQMVVDGEFVYVTAGDGVYVIEKAVGKPEQVISGITDPVGLLIDKQTSIAYVSTAAGALYIVDITSFSMPVYDPITGELLGASTTVAALPTTLSLGTSSGHLTWANDEHTAFFATLPQSNQIVRFDASSKAVTILQTDTPIGASPQSVVVFDDYNLSVVCDAEIGDIYCGMPITDVLLLGIGLIPFDYITNSIEMTEPWGPHDGKADTSSAPGYYFSAYPHLPFAGSLSILINHELAYNGGARYYKARWTNQAGVSRDITASYVDLRWNPLGQPPRFDPVTTSTENGFYPVRDPDELWYNPFFGFVVDTSESDNGHNRLQVDFFDGDKQPMLNGSFERLVFVDATTSKASLLDLRIGTADTAPADGTNQAPSACGVLEYTSKDNRIAIDMTAWRVDGLGTYTLSCYRGGSPTFSLSGNVTVGPTPISVLEYAPGVPFRIGHLVGACDVANVAIGLNVPARAINGFGWVDLGGRAGKSFALAKSPVNESPWTPPT